MKKWLDKYQSKGEVKNSLNRKVTCSNCGWSWKLSDGGEDPLTCHKCGGTIKMKNGGEIFTSNESIGLPNGPNYVKKFIQTAIITNRGQWDYPGQTTIIPSNEITMQGVPYPVLGVDNLGNEMLMQPEMNYTFPGQYVTEYPMMQYGGQHNKLVKYQNKGEVKKAPSVVRTKKNLITNREDVPGDSFTGTMRREALAYLPYFKDAIRYLEKGASYITPDYKSQADRELLFKRHRPVAYPSIFSAIDDVITDYDSKIGKKIPYANEIKSALDNAGPFNVVTSKIKSTFFPEQKQPFKDPEGDYEASEEAWRMTLGLPVKNKYIIPSKYRPLDEKDKTSKYYTLREDMYNKDLLRQKIKELKLKPGQSAFLPSFAPFVNENYMNQKEFSDVDPLQNFKIGVNKNGKMYFYDKYDFDFEPLSKVTRPYEYEFYNEFKTGGQHGGLDRWFAEKWVDIKTGKPCGRQEGENRNYPACRPSKRISSDTPKTASELSSAEKQKFKQEKTSSQRISYNHNRKEYGGENIDNMNYLNYMKSGGNVPTNPSLWSRAKAAAKSKYDVYPCVPMDSQALTKEGWKYYNELSIGEDILAYNQETNKNEWTPIMSLQKFEDAPIIRLYKSQTNFDIKCTPNHKWVLAESNSKYPDNFVEAKDITKHMKIKISAELSDNGNGLDLNTFFKKDSWVKNILKMSISQIQSYFASGIVYDGHDKGLTKKENKQTYGFSQKEKDHGLAMEIAAVLLGYRVCSVVKKHNPTIMSWTFIRRNTESTQNLHKEDAGISDVWCPTTKFGTWVMKQNGYVTITGNSAYANGFAAKWYKSHGGSWRKAEYGMEVMGNGGVPTNPGFVALPEYVQQNIINNMATGGQKMPPQLAYARFAAAGNLNKLGRYGYEDGGEEEVNNLKNINLNLPVYRKPEINPLSFNKFLVNDRNQNLFIGGINPSYQNENFSVGPYMIGVGNKYFQKFPVDYGVRGNYNVNDKFNINMNVGKNNMNVGMKYNFKNGGDVNMYGMQYQDGGEGLPNDFNKFQEFNKTLPDNLRDDNFKYGDYSHYDLYGMWDASGKPKSFDDVKDTEFFPLQEDGAYHGFSVGNDGIWLKPKSHPSAFMEYMVGQLDPNSYDHVIQREDGRLQYVPNNYITKKSLKQKNETDIPQNINPRFMYSAPPSVFSKGGESVTLNTGGENHRIYVKTTNRGEGKKGHIMVNHPTMDKGMWDTIDLTEKSGATTIAQGVAATKKWHRENPYIKEYGGDVPMYANGGSIPERYRNMGFTKVGAKKQSTRPGKKWMVLAKKGDDYKVVHGGYKGMQDFKQHHSEQRKENFWSRMGGKNSSKATDPFSPLYWHKRFGTWEYGGQPMAVGGQNVMNPIVKKDNRNWLEYLKN